LLKEVKLKAKVYDFISNKLKEIELDIKPQKSLEWKMKKKYNLLTTKEELC